MGGLRKKMPITAYTMLDRLLGDCRRRRAVRDRLQRLSFQRCDHLEQGISFTGIEQGRSPRIWLFYSPPARRPITPFYMFRLWYMTFAGEPRDHHRYDHAHESPPVMSVTAASVLAEFVVFFRLFGLLAGGLFFPDPEGIIGRPGDRSRTVSREYICAAEQGDRLETFAPTWDVGHRRSAQVALVMLAAWASVVRQTLGRHDRR